MMSKKIETEEHEFFDKKKMLKEVREAVQYFRENGDPNFMDFFDDNEWRVKNGRSPLAIEDDAR